MTECFLEKILAFLDFLKIDLPMPLKRCMRFWDKGGEADGNLPFFTPFSEHFEGKVGYAGKIVACFCGKADHEVQFYRSPAGIKDTSRRRDKVFFSISLIDDISQSLGSRFRGKGETRLSDPLDLVD